jgi:hypothetical protein
MIFDKAGQAFNEANSPSNHNKIENSILELDKALKLISWSKNLKSWECSLYFKNTKFHKALDTEPLNLLKKIAFCASNLEILES